MAIRSLTIIVQSDLLRELAAFIDGTEKSNSLRTFFRVFVKYAELHKKRRMLFIDLKHMYPDLIHMPHGVNSDMLQFTLRDKPGMQFIFSWTIKVNKYGIITVSTALQPKFAADVMKLDKLNIAQYLPEHFDKLTKIKGIKAAFVCMLSL